MFQEMELLASVAVFLAFFAAFAYHSELVQGALQSGISVHSHALSQVITLQELANAYHVAGYAWQIPGSEAPAPVNPAILGNRPAVGRMLTMGGYVYLLSGSNVTTGSGND